MGVGAIIGAVGGLAAAGGSIYSASQAGGSAPSPKGVGRGTIQAYYQTAPQQLALNELYNPQYLGLGTNNLQSLLFGSPGSSVTYNVPPWLGKILGTRDPTQTVNIPGQTGLFDVLGQAAPAFQNLGTQSANLARTADIAALNQYLPGLQQWYNQATPEQAALRTAISGNALDQLNLGTQLDPDTLNRITSGVRGSWANRGLGTSSPAMLDEAMQLYGGGQNLLQQREQNAISSLGQLYQTQPNYAGLILGEQGSLPAATSFLTGQQPLTYQQRYDPFNPTAANISLQGSAQQQQASQYLSSTLAGLGGGLLNMSGRLASQPTYPYYGGSTNYYGGGGYTASSPDATLAFSNSGYSPF